MTKLKKIKIFSSFFLLLINSSCQLNPATGEKDFNLMSQEEEILIGKNEHKKIIKQYGGIYNDKKLYNYINSLGKFIVNTTEQPDLNFTFTILDTPLVNAFALPGGYIYLTRGLIAICQNEAQLAGVIAHEIAHVTAKHAARRYSKNIGTNILTNILSVLANNQAIGNLINQSAGLYMLSYSRDQEYEADKLAIRYMNRAGFKSKEIGSLLRIMNNFSNFESRRMNVKVKSGSDFLSTHPSSRKRVKAVIQEAEKSSIPNPIIGKEIFLKKIDGLVFGDKVEEGVLTSKRFLHPKLNFLFELTEDFHFINLPKRVVGRNKNESKIVFDIENYDNTTSLSEHLEKIIKVSKNQKIKKFFVNGLEAASSSFLKDGKKITLAIITDRKTIFRFILIQAESQNENTSFFKIVKSFKLLSEKDKKKIEPNRIKIFSTKGIKNTDDLISKQSIQKSFSRDLFEIINDITQSNKRVEEKVKIIYNYF